ncbi:MFS transporter [Amycolatopsis sp. NPDC051071]|uniref:MFS transporter n=1 Tax=Amycolatopsis sp. NPDC051071 TaxID=3154637 RepID=UPI0034206295
MSDTALDYNAADPPAAGPGETTKTTLRSWLSLIAVAFGIMVVQIDGTVVAIANPAIAADLKAGLDEIQWVTTGYLLVLAGLLIPMGTLADKIGRKKGFLLGVGGFTLASAVCGMAGSIEVLVGGRVLQAIFGALLVPSALAVIRAAFPAEKLAMAIGIFSSFTALALAAGPILGGVLVEVASWPWVFFVNLPFGVLAVLLGLLCIKESTQGTPAPLDVPGAITLTLAMVSVVWAISNAQVKGWVSTHTLGFLGLGLVLLGVFLVIELKSKHPMVPLGLFRDRSLSIGTVLMVVVMFAFYAILFYLTFYLQGVQGKNGVAAGIALLPLTAVFTISSPVGGWVTGKLGPRGALVTGAVFVTGSLAVLLLLETDSGMLTLAPSLVLGGFGMGFMMVAATQAILGNAPVDKAGVASGVQQSMTQLGGVLGTSVFGTLLASSVMANFATNVRSAFAGGGGPVGEQLANNEEVRKSVELGFGPASQDAVATQLSQTGMPSGQVQEVVGTLTRAAHETFIQGLHTVFGVAVGVAVVAGLVSLLVRNPKEDESAEAAPAAAEPSIHV